MDEESVKNSGSILLVEDDSFLARVLDERLRQEGYEVTICRNGKEGLEVAKRATHDLALLDVILPELDGISILREIKSDENLASLEVIVLSNVSDPDKIKEVKSLGADYYVKSATELSEIVEKIQEKLQMP
ncbi:MAG TPA: response regulator [Candidatus Paceibacterota bacterium]|nr:response regulator [Candidatus Paceibacterota bacterium]